MGAVFESMPHRDFLVFDQVRASDSPFIEQVWRCHSEGAGPFVAVASGHWELVVSKVRGATSITLHGGETRAREVQCPADGEWFAIRFAQGTWMPRAPAGRLLDGHDLDLPLASRRRFLLNGSRWPIPAFDDAEAFVARLARAGILMHDAAAAAALAGDEDALSLRSAQRHIRRSTGMARATLHKIERAREATRLLRAGLPIQDVVHQAGYFDQAHLARSLKLLAGLTPAQVQRGERQLSFLYKTTR